MLSFHGDSHPGRIEESNEDCIGWDIARGVWLVADGMGGHSRGEVAARVVKETILEEVARDLPLKQTLLDAHEAVIRTVEESGDARTMGSTVVAVRIVDGECEIVWVGDSRAYLWRKRAIEQVSTDHSLLQLLLATKRITQAEARHHPKRNLVTQTLGMGNPTPDERHITLRKNDRLLLCSDGLSDELTDEEIATQLARSRDLKSAVDNLIDAALEAGGKDNISVIIIEYSNRKSMIHRLLSKFLMRWKPAAMMLGTVLALRVNTRWRQPAS